MSDDKISYMQVCKGFRVGRVILLVFIILLSKPESDKQHTKTEAHNLKPVETNVCECLHRIRWVISLAREEPGLRWTSAGYKNASQHDLLIAFVQCGQVSVRRSRN